MLLWDWWAENCEARNTIKTPFQSFHSTYVRLETCINAFDRRNNSTEIVLDSDENLWTSKTAFGWKATKRTRGLKKTERKKNTPAAHFTQQINNYGISSVRNSELNINPTIVVTRPTVAAAATVCAVHDDCQRLLSIKVHLRWRRQQSESQMYWCGPGCGADST